MRRLLTFFAFFSAINLVLAQDVLFKGRVVDEQQQPVENVLVSIGSSPFVSTDMRGYFEVMASKPGTAVNTVNVEKDGYEKVGFQYIEDTELKIVMRRLPILLGRLLNNDGEPVNSVEVRVETASFKGSDWSDDNGLFRLSLEGKKPNFTNANFFVDGELIPSNNIVFDGDYSVNIIVRSGKQQPKEEEDNDGLFFKVTVYLADGTTAKNIHVKLEGIEYLTDEQGEFIVNGSREKPSDIEAEGYDITSSSYDNTRNHLIIRVEERNEPVEAVKGPVVVDSLVLEYREDFNLILRQLEIRKQSLNENSLRIKTEMERVAEQLNIQGQELNDNQRENLSQDLLILESELIKNELKYETAQEETKKILDQMKYTLRAKETQIEEIESAFEKELAVFIVVALVLAALALTSYMVASRIRKQKEELEQAYQNIQTISDIGKEITATLDFETLVQTVHASVDSLIDATIFGVGITNPTVNKIEFKSYIERGETQSYFYESLDDDQKFSVWCLKNRKSVVINDLETEYKKYITTDHFEYNSGMPRSLIYLPLIIENEAIGVITVQSFRKNAYKVIDTTILQTLASYVSIALDNSNAYEVIKDKNKNITNSIRYAQTIQEAILPSPSVMDKYLTEHFIIYRPKDIVSGDFYWFSHVPAEVTGKKDKLFVAAVDCTGHGVPGAFMSMIGSTLLDEIIEQKKIYDTAGILEMLNESVKEALKQESKVNDDGMDICLCSLEREENGYKVLFTGAKRSLHYFSKEENQLITIKGDTKSIGGIQRKKREFTQTTLHLKSGDVMYLSSDGLADQSNPEKEKFGSKRLVELLEEVALLHLPEQERAIEKALDSHQGEAEQRDDILLMGIQI